MAADWLLTGWREAALALLSAPFVYAAVIALTRLNGLRSFAQMSAFDFAMTVAVGTLLSSSIATGQPSVLQAIVVLAALFALQYTVARLRVRWSWLGDTVDNRPLLLAREGRLLRANMAAGRVTEADLWAQLRLARVLHLADVAAVVLETTGSISVLHVPGRSGELDERLLFGVRTKA